MPKRKIPAGGYDVNNKNNDCPFLNQAKLKQWGGKMPAMQTAIRQAAAAE